MSSASGQAMRKTDVRAGDSIEFSYAQAPHDPGSLKGVSPGKTRVYLGFEMQREDIRKFAGSKVTGFSVYSPFANYTSTNTVVNGRFFYSLDLKTEEYAQDFKFSMKAGEYNTKSIDEPYTITGDEESLFFGYSLVVPKANNMLYLVSDKVPNKATALLYGTSDEDAMPGSFFSAGESLGALCMAVTLERDGLPHTATFSDMPEVICLPYGEGGTYPFNITATIADPIETMEIEYSLGGRPYTAEVKWSPAIAGGTYRNFVAEVDFPAISEEIAEQVAFRITKINGRDNEAVGEADTRVAILEHYPDHQTLYEEYTGTWCGFCPRGFAALEYIAKNHPGFVTASFHYGQGMMDPMQALDFYPTSVKNFGFPCAVLNRNSLFDPYFGSQAYAYPVPIVGDILARNAVRTVWSVNVSHKWIDEDTLEAEAEVANMAGFDDGEYKVAYMLIADGLSGTTPAWMQYNNLSADAPVYVEELNAFCRGGKYGQDKVTGLVFNDVVVSPDGVLGIKGSVPSRLEPGERVSHGFAFDLRTIPSDLIPDKRKLRVVAMVLDKDGNVLNCAKDEVDDFDPNAVEGIFDANAPAEYFDLNGTMVAEPTEGIYIRRQGAKADKVIIR